MEIIRELFDFAKTHKKMWLMPILLFVLLLGALLVAAKGSAVAPFIYAVF